MEHVDRWREITDFYRACSDPVIVDACASIGATSAWFALAYPKARILAVEPDVGRYEALERNANSFPAIAPQNAAIASSSGTLVLYRLGTRS
jgi:FkbM family methyltransferase